jgi:hypothetical protein
LGIGLVIVDWIEDCRLDWGLTIVDVISKHQSNRQPAIQSSIPNPIVNPQSNRQSPIVNTILNRQSAVSND